MFCFACKGHARLIPPLSSCCRLHLHYKTEAVTHPPQAHGFMQHTYTSLLLNSLPSPRTSASLAAQVKWSQSAAHPWLANSQIGTGINTLYGWNSALEFRSWVQSQLLLIFSCHHFTLGCDVLQHSRIKCHCHTDYRTEQNCIYLYNSPLVALRQLCFHNGT